MKYAFQLNENVAEIHVPKTERTREFELCI